MPAATQRLLEQQASPAQLRLSQQGCPGFPHGLSVPSLQTMPAAEPIAPFGMQSLRPGSAQPPFRQASPVAQGGLPSVPQVSRVFSATQTAPLGVEVPSAMQSEPEQQPLPQPFWQQGCPGSPQATQRLLEQVWPGAVQRLNGAQQGWPGPPQVPQAPFVQIAFGVTFG